MVHLKPRRHPEQQQLLAACATSRPAPAAPAAHLSRRRDRDRVVGFADVAALPEPDWADTNPASRAQFWPGRYTVGALVPPGQLAAVLLPAVPERVLDDIDTVTADVAAALAVRPELRHDAAVLMALAPVVAMLKGLVA